jgi:integrase
MKGLTGAIRYAIELGRLYSNPLERISKTPPRKATTIDQRVVVNPTQARKLIAAVPQCGWTGPRLEAFFAALYYAALRPSEALALRIQDCQLPETGWGELCFAESAPYAYKAWTTAGDDSPRKALKHRAKNQSRTVPACPELVAHLQLHVEKFGTAPDGRFFIREDGGPIRPSTYAKIWAKARNVTLTPVQAASPLGKRPYDLRHAAVSTWLNAGVPAPQVAEWAGHSVEMLLSTYAKCVDGQADLARKRIEEALEWMAPEDGAKPEDPQE